MNLEEQYYLNNLSKILSEGISSDDRTGVGTKFLISQKFDYNISDGKIPIWTTRKVPWKNQVIELLWFINGRTDVKWLQDRGITIWNSWTKDDGTIGPGYGKQYRDCNGIDQFVKLIEGIKKTPESRRHIISLYNVADMEECVLPCCHGLVIQFIVEKKEFLHCVYYQRSADFCLGFCPWQYALLTNIIGRLTNLKPKSLSAIIGNNHVYLNQIEAAEKQLERIPTKFPVLNMNPNIKTISDVESSSLDDYPLANYTPQSFIKFPISV